MHFEIAHEFDIPLDAVELAVISHDLHTELARRMPSVASVAQIEHVVAGGKLSRVWSFRASFTVPAFAKSVVTPEMMAWDEVSTYDLARHEATWAIRPHVKPEWRKYFAAQGTYVLSSLASGRTRRTVQGQLDLRVPLVQKVAEKLIVAEVRKIFDAEADTLRDLATLA